MRKLFLLTCQKDLNSTRKWALLNVQFCLSFLSVPPGAFSWLQQTTFAPAFQRVIRLKRWRTHSLCSLAGTRISIQKAVSELPPTFLKEWRKKLDLRGGSNACCHPEVCWHKLQADPRICIHSYKVHWIVLNPQELKAVITLLQQDKSVCLVYHCMKCMHLPSMLAN